MPVAQDKFKSFCAEYGLEYVRQLAEDGVSLCEMAKRCGISLSTLERWRRRYPRFRDAIELGRREADFSVVEAIYKRATGFNVTTNKTHKLKRVDYDPDTGRKLREYEELAVGVDEEYIAPDLRAGMFWLKNRQPERFGERASVSEVFDGGVVELPQADSIDPLPEQDSEDQPL